MNRPYLVNFSAIISEKQMSIRASLTDSLKINLNSEQIGHGSPIQSISLINKSFFRVKIIGMDKQNITVFRREYDTDNYGTFEIRVPLSEEMSALSKLTVFETSKLAGFDLHLGSFLPLEIDRPKKIIISDFDKTLVDTKYHTLKEMYYSLNRPLNYFPSVDSSIELLKSYIDDGFRPFILSASPHFYENAIRDWLYQNQIYANSIFLKDYRDFFSLFEGALSTKDLKAHGFYKLNQLINILLMTRLADELVLMGDGFESDPFIYLTLQHLLDPHTDPWKLWKSIRSNKIFRLTTKQDSYFITKFYQLHELAKKSNPVNLTIHIRATEDNIDKLKNQNFKNKKIEKLNPEVRYYI